MWCSSVARCLIAVGAICYLVASGGQVFAWSNEGVRIKSESYNGGAYDSENVSSSSRISVMGNDEQVRELDAVLFEGRSVRMARTTEGRWTIARGTDSVYRYLGVTDGTATVIVPGTNKIVTVFQNWSYSGSKVAIINDITQGLQPEYGAHGIVVRYHLKDEAINYWLRYRGTGGTIQVPNVYSYTFSENRRFGVFWLNWEQFVRVDFKTGESRAFLNARGYWTDGIYSRQASAITNDGRYAFMDNGRSFIDIQSTCGFLINPTTFSGSLDRNFIECPAHDMGTTEIAGYDGWRQSFHLSSDETTGTYIMQSFPYTSQNFAPIKITITSGDPTVSTVSYLALGDSYSSGEGDTEKNPKTNKKYYLDGTDKEATSSQPREKCHISSRSYPFKLGSFMRIHDSTQSVACSGAVIDDLNGTSDEYKGQKDGSKGRLDGLSTIDSMQTEAMSKFIPGRVRQIDFVKEYKPEAITLTAGGNDAHFADVIMTCINVNPTKDWTPTCRYADSNNGRSDLEQFISKRYEPLKKLYTEMHNASPSTKIYVLGYPQFINADVDDSECKVNVRLNKPERVMIRESVDYMNSVIKQAAKAAGVKYVDVSSALVGHKLCDSKDNPGNIYVTGIALRGDSEIQESYHPDGGGHSLIGNAIKRAVNDKSLLEYDYCTNGATVCPDDTVSAPPAPSYFSKLSSKNVETIPIVPTKAKKGTQIIVKADSSTVAPSATIQSKLYSKEYILPAITANADGSIDAGLPIPADIEPGYHTLVFTGTSPSGDEIEIVNFIEIYASENDRDSDGMPDAADRCTYIKPVGIDEDEDGIDDGCDASIGTKLEKSDTQPEASVTPEKKSEDSAPSVNELAFTFAQPSNNSVQVSGLTKPRLVVDDQDAKITPTLVSSSTVPPLPQVQQKLDATDGEHGEENGTETAIVGAVPLLAVGSLVGILIGRLIGRKNV